MTFGEAIEAMKQENAIRRDAWPDSVVMSAEGYPGGHYSLHVNHALDPCNDIVQMIVDGMFADDWELAATLTAIIVTA